MKIIKYCKKEHHPKNCDTIQVGTLDYYRESDNEFIADPNEAAINNLKLIPTKKETFSIDECNWLFNGGIKMAGEGHFPGMVGDVGSTLNINSRIQIPNSYIFCCSIVKEASESQMKDLGYDSWYEITDFENFQKDLFQMLIQVKLKNKGYLKENSKILSDRIYYGPRDNIEFRNKEEILPFLLFGKSEVSQINKDIHYWRNSEYRLVFLLFKENSVVPLEVEQDPVLVNNKSLLKYFKY